MDEERGIDVVAWEPDPRIVRLIEWALAGAPECGPLPEGAREILAVQRRAALFEAWEGVRAFGAPAAEPLRVAYCLPEELTHQPEGIVTRLIGDYRWDDGIAEMLQSEIEWAEKEWPTRESLHDYLFRRPRRILWKRMREEDRQNAAVVCATVLDLAQYQQPKNRAEMTADVEKSMSPIRRQMPKLDRHFRILVKAADPKTAVVDRSAVARKYRIPEERIDGFLSMIEREWSPELNRLREELGGYVKRRKVRVDATSQQFKILPEDV